MADNLRKYTTQEVLNKVYTDSSGITIGLNSQTSKETLNAVLDSSNNRLQVAMAGGTISGDVTISGDLTVSGDSVANVSETITGTMEVTSSSLSSFIRTSTETNAVRGALYLKHTTTGGMVDGFGSGLSFQIRDSAGADNDVAHIFGIRDGADNQGALTLNTNTTGGALTERMRIDTLGNVDFKINDGGSVDVIPASGMTGTFNLKNSGGTILLGLHTALSTLSGFSNNSTVYSSGALQIFGQGDNPLALGTNSTNRLHITGDGEVGIGNTGQSGVALNVTGKIRISDKLEVNSNNFIIQTASVTAIDGASDSLNMQFMNAASSGDSHRGFHFTSNKTHCQIDGQGNLIFRSTAASGADVGNGASLYLQKDDGQAMANNDVLGEVIFQGAEDSSNNLITGARIFAHNSRGSAWDASNNHCDLVFATTTGDASLAKRMTIADDGLVGIGVDSPSALLSVGNSLTSTSAGTIIINDNASYRAEFGYSQSSSTQMWFNNSYDNAASVMQFRMAGSTKMTLKGDGNVGIGTSLTPSHKLHISHNSSTTYGLYVEHSASEYSGLAKFYTNSSNNTARSLVEIHNDNSSSTAIIPLKLTQDADGVAFHINAGGNDVMKIDNNSRISLSNNDNNTSNTVFGKNAFNASSDNGSDFNVVIGEDAMSTGSVNSAQYNVAIGYQAFDDATSGKYNVLIGAIAGTNLAGGSDNVAIGTNALKDAVSVTKTISIGTQALENINDDANDGSVAIGHLAASGKVGTGSQYTKASVHIGYSSGAAQTTGANNTSVGHASLAGNASGTALTGGDNTVIGYSAGYAMHTGSSGNTLMGSQAGQALTTGSNNVAVGFNAGTLMTDNSNNIMIGRRALGSADSGEGNNVVIGDDAGRYINNNNADNNVLIGNASGQGGTGELKQCVVIGSLAMDATGSNGQTGTIAIGYQALTELTTGDANTAIGYQAGSAITTNSFSTFIGKDAGKLVTGGNNTIIGAVAGDALTTGTANVAVGTSALGAATGAVNYCVAVGEGALAGSLVATGDNPSGAVGVGYQAGVSLASAIGFTGLGYQAGYNNNGADKATYIGYHAGFNGTFNHNNTYVGYKSGYGASGGGEANSALGTEALTNVNGAVGNVAVGWKAGDVITSGDYNTLIGYNADADAATDSYQVKIGVNGIKKFKTARITLSEFSSGNNTAGKSAHTNALFTIPSKSFISKIVVKVVTLSSNSDHLMKVVFSSTLDEAVGDTIASPTTVIAASGIGTGYRSRSSINTSGDASIQLGTTGGTASVGDTYISQDEDLTDSSTAWATADVGFYIAHAGSNTNSAASTSPIIDILVEYY